jgi:hypothetical protein
MPHNAARKRRKLQVHHSTINSSLNQTLSNSVVHTLPHCSIGQLRRDYNQTQTLLPEALKRIEASNKFTRFPLDSHNSLLIKGYDGGTIVYRVSLNDDEMLRRLNDSVRLIPQRTHKSRSREGVYRGRYSSRYYTVWRPYSKEPFYSKDMQNDQPFSQQFMDNNKDLWEKMSSVLQNIFPGNYKRFVQCKLPSTIQRLAGAWMGAVVNIGTDQNPVETEPHCDVKETVTGVSCLCPFGEYTGGAIIL